MTGRMYLVKKTTNSNELLLSGGSAPIDGASSVTLSTSGNGFPYVNVVSDGSAWYVSSCSTEGISLSPYDPNTLLLISGRGANGSTAITDSSMYARAIIIGGNAQITTAIADPFGSTEGVIG